MLKIKRVHSDAVLPSRGTSESAGLDLYTLESWVIQPRSTLKIGTGIAVAIPEGHVGLIRPRSSALTRGLAISGTIDSDYRGEIFLVVTNVGEWTQDIAARRAYAQLIITPYLKTIVDEVVELDNTGRGSNGFGSTTR